MDEATKNTIDRFVNYLASEIIKFKDNHHIEVGKWYLEKYKVTVEIFKNKKKYEIYFDLRELLENAKNFHHLLDSIISQIKAFSDE